MGDNHSKPKYSAPAMLVFCGNSQNYYPMKGKGRDEGGSRLVGFPSDRTPRERAIEERRETQARKGRTLSLSNT